MVLPGRLSIQSPIPEQINTCQMLALGDRMVWATVYGVLGRGLPQSVTHGVWCLRAQSLLLTQLRQEQCHKHQKPQRASSPFHFTKCAANQFCCLGG